MENLSDSLLLTVLGMGVVFIFLTVLVLAITATSRIIQRYFPETTSPTQPQKIPLSQSQNSEALIAAATAAVHMHRQKHK